MSDIKETKLKKIPLKFTESDNYTVVQSNKLLGGQFLLSANEHKLMDAIISQINPMRNYCDDSDIETYFEVSLTRKEIADLTGIKSNNLVKFLHNAASNFSSMQVALYDANGEFDILNVFQRATFQDNDFTIKFTPDATKELYDLAEKRYTQHYLVNTTSLKNKYAIRLYKLLKERFNQKLQYQTVKFEISEIYFRLGLVDPDGVVLSPRYLKSFSEFKTRVFQKAINEISERSDLNVSLGDTKRDGRKVRWVFLEIGKKSVSSGDPVIEYLKELGFDDKAAYNLLDAYESNYLERHINYYNDLLNDEYKPDNPKAFFKHLLKNQYALIPEKVNPYSSQNRNDPKKVEFLRSTIVMEWEYIPEKDQFEIELLGFESDLIKGLYKQFLDGQGDLFSKTTR